VNKYLEQIEALKKPKTHRKYEAVLKRFLDYFLDRDSIDAISADDLTGFVVSLKKDHRLGSFAPAPIEIAPLHPHSKQILTAKLRPGRTLLQWRHASNM